MTYDKISPPEPANDNDTEPMTLPLSTEASADIAKDDSEAVDAAPSSQAETPPIMGDPHPSRRPEAEQAAARLILVPDLTRDARNHARLVALIDQIYNMAQDCFAEASREDEPGPRTKLISAAAALTGQYVKLLEKELVLRAQLLRAQ
jgi:hypothetical protein